MHIFFKNIAKPLTNAAIYGTIIPTYKVYDNYIQILGKEAFGMEMSIAALSMDMAMSNMQDALSIGMLKKTMESSEAAMATITDMLDNMPSPDGRGLLLNVRA